MAPTERVRVNHPPDFIINGKPKWTELSMIESQAEKEETYVVDRLNPSRNMIGSIESNYREKAESTQMTMVNMMSDLKCELVVTLGDVRLSQDQEAELLSQHHQWELYKVTHSIMFFPSLETLLCTISVLVSNKFELQRFYYCRKSITGNLRKSKSHEKKLEQKRNLRRKKSRE